MSFLKNSFKLRPQAELDAEQKAKEEEQTRQYWLTVERSRKEREKYEIKEAAGWIHVGPFIGLIVAAIAGLMLWLSGTGDTTGLWWIIGISMIPLILAGLTTSVDDDWKASVVAKKEIEKGQNKSGVDDNYNDYSLSSFGSTEMTLNGFRYDYGHIYTDSALKYWFYKLAKFVMGLSTIGFGILAAILLFVWLGSVSIAPTTIIIILLIFILIKMK